ncbi:MAG: CapA family protein [Candidatus Pacebacteria bacterium]|nr:CapA family protein [Candidatus Paceibacterota bacterium]
MRISRRFIFLLFFILAIILVTCFFILKSNWFKKDNLWLNLNNFLEQENKEIKMIFVGDIMLNRGVEYMINKYGKGDYKFPFLKIADYLNNADVLFGNLESVISDKGVNVGSIYSFRADPKAINGLKYAGFDIVSVANNHIFDYGRESMEDSFNRLNESDIKYIGGGFTKEEACQPKIIKVEDSSTSSGQVKIGFLGYTAVGSRYWEAEETGSGICWLDENIKQDIVKAKEKSDLVVVSAHWGDEYQSEPNDQQKYWGHFMIEAGADLVIGHHPHTIQTIEEYNEGYIVYSLGNFIFDQGFSKETMTGNILQVLVEAGKIKEVNLKEIKINNFFQPVLLFDAELP